MIATAAAIAGDVAVLRPILNSQDYLIKMAASEHQVILGALLLVVAAFASPAIALWLYPVLRERTKGGLALGSVGFRLIEGVFYAMSVVLLLSLLTLSQELVKAGASASSSFDTAGTVLRAARDWAGLVGSIRPSSGSAGDVPCHHHDVDRSGCLQPSNRCAGNRPSGMADRQGLQSLSRLVPVY